MKTRTTPNRETGKGLQILLSALFISILLLTTSECPATTMDRSDSRGNGNAVISAYELHKILTDHFGFISIKLSDAQYALPDTGTLDQLKNSACCGEAEASGTRTSWGEDDYAIAAMVPMRNYAFGTVYVDSPAGNKRVMNVFVNSSKQIVYWEAKTCKYYEGNLDKAEFILF